MPSEMTYTRCPACAGTLRVGLGGAPGGGPYTDCPCTRSVTPGWAETGVALPQLEAYAERERALRGDPGLPEARRREVLDRLAVRVLAAQARMREGG